MAEKPEKTKKEKEAPKKLTEKEFETKILELAERGLTSEKIGEALRKEKIHSKEHGKKISKVLKENDKYTIPEIKNIKEKLEKIKDHYENNKQDKRSMRERDRTAAKLRKIKKYHKVA